MKDDTAFTERYRAFTLMMLSGGFMGAFSYINKGGVFASAETANCLILAIGLASGDCSMALSVVPPILTYFVGAFFSEMGKDKLQDAWKTILLSFEIAALLALSLLPPSVPDPVFHVSIALISSMQYNTFNKARGVALATLFCTGHIRGTGASLYHAISDRDREKFRVFLYHFGMICTFIAGAFLCRLVSPGLGNRTIALPAIPLAIVLWEVVRERKVRAKN